MGASEWFPSPDRIAIVLHSHRHEAQKWPRHVTPIPADQEPAPRPRRTCVPRRLTALESKILSLLQDEPRVNAQEIHEFFHVNLAMSEVLVLEAGYQRDTLAGRSSRPLRLIRPRAGWPV